MINIKPSNNWVETQHNNIKVLLFIVGVSVVVSPLVSLMDDQLYALGQLGINAALLNASSSKQEVNRIHAEMTDKNTQLKVSVTAQKKTLSTS